MRILTLALCSFLLLSLSCSSSKRASGVNSANANVNANLPDNVQRALADFNSGKAGPNASEARFKKMQDEMMADAQERGNQEKEWLDAYRKCKQHRESTGQPGPCP